MKTPNWQNVTVSILKALDEAGFKVVGVDNGDGCEPFTDIHKAAEEAAATDEAYVFFKHKNDPVEYWAFLVYGNSICETISDYNVRENETGELFNKTIVKWSNDMEYPYKV